MQDFKELSYRKIVDHLSQFYDVKICHATLISWVKKYLKLLSQYAETNEPRIGNVWHADEMTANIRKKGGRKKYWWIWNVMDTKTRYLLACHVTENKFVKDAQEVFQKVKTVSDTRPDLIITDGLLVYEQAIHNEFWDRDALIKNPHFRLKSFEEKPNNNPIERLNGSIRERTKVMRGFDNDIGTQEFCEGIQTYYNYIRPHQGLGGLTPALVAGIPFGMEGNRWMRMIELANLK
jgi:transposase-like protein